MDFEHQKPKTSVSTSEQSGMLKTEQSKQTKKCGVSTIITDNNKMNKIKTSLVMVLFFVAMIFFSSCSKDKEIGTDNLVGETKLKSANFSKPSVNGQGALFLDYPGFIQGVQHFSFHANTDANGNVTGSFESKWGQNGRIHGTINCLSILPDGKTAILSGALTHVQGETYINYGFLVGDKVWFKVQDNGEGANATKDRFSDSYAGSDLEPCTTDYGVDLFPIQNGNIQVKP